MCEEGVDGHSLACKVGIEKQERCAIDIEADTNTSFVAHTPTDQASCNGRLGCP
ncbi:hypothetical protein Ac2012v2_002635 [Leucoagaricus gongylophorus]